MNKKQYEKRLEFQEKIILKKSEEIEFLNSKIEDLKLELSKKDEIINSIEPMRSEMVETISQQQKLKDEYEKLVQELKQMKEIFNQEVYKGRWKLIKLLIK